MQQNYKDAMAIVLKYGKPDLFVTMTCNPNWREIRENL
jgi:ATP-dependent DNA helicase PIF1